jgi:hypothetical protein
MGDVFMCLRHGLLTAAIIEDWLSPSTREMLAHAKWETFDEGRQLIAHMYAREAA